MGKKELTAEKRKAISDRYFRMHGPPVAFVRELSKRKPEGAFEKQCLESFIALFDSGLVDETMKGYYD